MNQRDGFAAVLIVIAAVIIVLNVVSYRRARRQNGDTRGRIFGIAGMLLLIISMTLLLIG